MCFAVRASIITMQNIYVGILGGFYRAVNLLFILGICLPSDCARFLSG